MKKSKIFSLNGHVLISSIIQNKLLILLTTTTLIGIYIGCILIKKDYSLSCRFASDTFADFLSLRCADNTFFKILFSSLLTAVIYAILIFLGGTSFVGILFSPTVLFIKSVLLGTFSAYIYSAYGLKGIAFNVLIFIPCNLFLLLGLILAVKESVCFSLTLAKLTMPQGYAVSIFNNFKKYCMRFLVVLLLLLLSSILDAFCSSVFIKFFNF